MDGYIYYHPYIDRDVSYNVRNHIASDRQKEQALYPGVGAYNCRMIEGDDQLVRPCVRGRDRHQLAAESTRQLNVERHGRQRPRYRKYLPNLWKGAYPGHNFYWGMNFSTIPDPTHFQYVTGY